MAAAMRSSSCSAVAGGPSPARHAAWVFEQLAQPQRETGQAQPSQMLVVDHIMSQQRLEYRQHPRVLLLEPSQQ